MDQEEQNVQETSQEQTSEQQEKMFTQSEVARIVKDRVKRSEDKMRSQLFEEAKSKVKAEQDEAKKLEEMNATQRRKYEDQKRDEELDSGCLRSSSCAGLCRQCSLPMSTTAAKYSTAYAITS